MVNSSFLNFFPYLLSPKKELEKYLTAKRELMTKRLKGRLSDSIDQGSIWPHVISKNECNANLIKYDCVYEEEASLNGYQYWKEICDMLPSPWKVITISIDSKHDEMYISILFRKSDPCLVRLPLRRYSLREGDNSEGLSFREASSALKHILDESYITTHSNDVGQSKAKKMEWWTNRKELDKQLCQLLQRLENEWLGAFKVTKLIEKNRLMTFLRSV